MQLDLFAPDRRVGRSQATLETVFVRHRWARRYILRVLDDGTLRVTLPKWGSKREAIAFVESSAPWIARQRVKQQEALRSRVDEGAAGDGGPSHEGQWRKRAAAELPPQVLALAAHLGITVSRISIRNQRTRWGACSARGSITLNWRLILVPDFVREYVMIHELMHRREMNHSKRFWKHVAAACPRYREARHWLLRNGPRVFSGSAARDAGVAAMETR
ncbi:MAG TPA: SprT family zinc-dependent metalloprotease [Vicinamibacterales bacterium]|nr:SprT family zinc-dependent metalloprotease [Vicinamibacterales bacterium]